MQNVTFWNKNLYRKYPVRADSSLLSEQGVEIPLNLFSAISISTKYPYYDLYISKIVVNGNFLNVTITHHDDSDPITIGYFSADITEDYQVIPMTPMRDWAGGNLVVGQLEALDSVPGSYTLTVETGKLEDSVVTCIKTPPVSSIVVDDENITGEVSFLYDNIYEVTPPADTTISLDVDDVNLVMSRTDQGTSKHNCPTSMIGTLNDVEPDEDGNIDIIGIQPIEVTVTASGIELTTPGIGFTEICKNVNDNIPPIPDSDTEAGKNAYLEDFLAALTEEWKSWPQYN